MPARGLFSNLPKGSDIRIPILSDVEPGPLSRLPVHFLLEPRDLVHAVLQGVVVVRSPGVEGVATSTCGSRLLLLLYDALLAQRAEEVLLVELVLLDDDPVELVILVPSEEHLVVGEVAKGGVEELLREFGVVYLPVLKAEGHEAQLPGDEEHERNRKVAPPPRISD